LQFLEQIGFRSEVAESLIATFNRLRHFLLHLGTVVTVEAVSLNKCGFNALAPEDLLEGSHNGGGSRARGTGDGYDGVLGRHNGSSSQADARKRPRVPNSGAS